MLSLAFVGGGLNSAVGRAHYSASRMDGIWRLDAGCFSKDRDRNFNTAAEWGVSRERVYRGVDELIDAEQDKVDAVVVLTPTPEHTDPICKLLAANIPVISEKALVSNGDDLQKIKNAFIPNRSFLAVTYNYSGYPMMRELKRRIAQNELGRINQIQVEMPADSFMHLTVTPQPWRLVDGEIPTILLDLGVHLHHLCYFLTGLDPVAVNADFHNYSKFNGIVDDAHIWVKYKEGMNASFWVSKTALGYRNGLKVRIFGEKGAAEWYQMDPEYLIVNDLKGRKMILDRGNAATDIQQYDRFKPGHPIGFVEAFANLYKDIADVLTNRVESPYVYGLKHAEQGLRLLSSANISNSNKSWIDIN